MTTIPDRLGLDDINDIPTDPDDYGAWPFHELVNPNGQPIHNPWQPLNLNTLPEHPPVQPTLGNLGLVYPGKRHVFSGPQESAKTLAAYAIGIHITRDGQPIILIDFEMGAWDTRTRLRELGATNQDLDHIHYIEPTEPAKPDTMTGLLELQPQLVIIDAAAGAYDLQSLDDNKRQDVERFTRLYVRTFWQAEIATIVLDHVVKDTETRGRYAIGSERKVGGADVHLGFDTITPISRGGKGRYKITTHKDRGGFLKRGHLADIQLESDPDTHQITWTFTEAQQTEDGEPFRPTHLMEKVSAYVHLHPEGVSRNQIETDITGKRDYLRQAIDALITDGHAQETPGPRGAKLITNLSLYLENTTSPHLAPTSPGRGPTTSPPTDPPYGGRGEVDGEQEQLPRPQKTGRSQDPDHDIPF